MRRKTLKSGLSTLVLVLVLLAGVRIFNQGRFESLQGRPTVADGDSLTLAGKRIRLLGLDAPELAQTCRSGGEDRPCGIMARQALRDIIGGRAIRCEAEDTDRYERLLARCTLDGEDIGGILVGAGWAISTGDYGTAEGRARATNAGIWAMRFVDPADWRATNERDGASAGFWTTLWN